MILVVTAMQLLAIALTAKRLMMIAGVALFFWVVMMSSAQKATKTIRKSLLAIFSVLSFVAYLHYAPKITTTLIAKLNLNYVMSEALHEFKGTDWADGILTATFFFIYLAFLGWLWILEKKASKPPTPDKPFKIEARIGNVKD